MDNFKKIIKKIGNKEDFFFVQVGSHDGVSFDPINEFILKYNWSGVLIEPITDFFELLVENYKGRDNLIFENLGVSSKPDVADFKYFPKKYASKYVKSKISPRAMGCAGMDFDYNKKRGKICKHIKTQSVKLITFADLVKKHKLSHVDLLQIDAEGHDFEVIKGIDFKDISPDFIHFESDKLDKKITYKFLEKHGYYCVGGSGDCDTLAINKSKYGDII